MLILKYCCHVPSRFWGFTTLYGTKFPFLGAMSENHHCLLLMFFIIFPLQSVLLQYFTENVNLFQCNWFIKEQFEHNTNFPFLYAQFHSQETLVKYRKQHLTEPTHLEIHKTETPQTSTIPSALQVYIQLHFSASIVTVLFWLQIASSYHFLVTHKLQPSDTQYHKQTPVLF